jgi:hypothetical protein
MKEVFILKDLDFSKEYFCTNCLQMRASVHPKPTQCRNCNSKDIIIGDPYSLDKEKLLEKYKKDKGEL